MDEEENKKQAEEQVKKGFEVSETMLYKGFIKVANQLLAKPLAILGLAKRAVAHLFKYESVRHLLTDAKQKIGTTIRLVEAYARGQYREVSTRNVALSVAALLYLVSPIDFIPDFLAAGLLDDVALLLWVYNNYQEEMNGFLAWEDQQKIRIELPPHEEEEK
jgi:uncharacterized membrane protein YkvA (DUF1232 family)